MNRRVLDPFADLSISPEVAAMPKADLHLHQELFPRMDRVVARREGRPPFDWRAWARQMMETVPPGNPRLGGVYRPDPTLGVDRSMDRDAEMLIGRVADIFEEEAADGAIYVEVRFGAGLFVTVPDAMAHVREAERRVRATYPRLRCEAIGFLLVTADAARLRAEAEKLTACVRAARDGLGGIDIEVLPYDETDDPELWATAHAWGEIASAAGLGVTIHVGEFSPIAVAAALRTPGLRRIGHGTHIADDPRLMDQVAQSRVTLECALTSNVVLGSAGSYEDHPIRRFKAYGIPVTLNTDLPMHVCTTIGREYAIAAALGFSPDDLLGFTRNAVMAGFTTAERRAALLGELQATSSRM